MPVAQPTLEPALSNLPSAAALPELLAPAGDWECAKAAVENGADAIYFGLEKFNARMRAHNFTEADLPKLMEFLHRRGVKGYVTFNTLVFSNEIAGAEEYLRAIISAGVDAAIVQDVGICRLIRKLSPNFPIHASTQMTITSAAGIDFAKELGCNLVVLARECSIAEIEKMSRESSVERPEPKEEPSTLDSRPSTFPLEVFVHGALCVAYSGQCLTSEALGGRSANRGECAQACRMPYELVSDGKLVPLANQRYLLSPQDLAGLDVLPELVSAGVASLKIEGRLKAPEYVANITRVYRQALDNLRSPVADLRTNRAMRQSEIENRKYDMEMAFSRGLYTGWFGGTNNRELVHARFGKKRGVYLGEIKVAKSDSLLVRLEGPLKPGDGVVIDTGTGDDNEQGGRIIAIHSKGALTEVCFHRGQINSRRVNVGDKLWKTDDPELNRRIRDTFKGDAPKFLRPISFEIHGHTGKPMTVVARDEMGHVVRVDSAMPLAIAEKQPLTEKTLIEQFSRVGGTPFKLEGLKNLVEGSVILPINELNRLRREAVQQLETLRIAPKRWTLTPGSSRREEAQTSSPENQSLLTSAATESELIVLVRTMPQLEAVLRARIATIYCEFEDPKRYREAVARVRAAQSEITNLKFQIFVAPPRITKPGEDWILKQVRSCEADGYLIRNYDHLKYFSDCRRIGDFSLNVANELSADYFKNRFGLERLTASYDLNIVQLDALLHAAPPEWFEVTIHQHMPMFHMEHCVFCAFLSTGKDYRDCGRPCDKHEVKLRDRVGMEHPLKADAGCRNTVFNARAQTGAEFTAHLMKLGVRHFRIEFVNESPAEVEKTIGKYRALLRGEISGDQLWRELKLWNQLGLTRGQMEKI